MTPIKPRIPGSHYAAVTALIRQCAPDNPAEGIERAASHLGKSTFTLHGYSNESGNGEISFLQMCQLSQAFGATAGAEHLAMVAGGLFVPLPAPSADGEMAELSAEAADEFGQMLAELVRDLSVKSDGGTALTQSESRRVLAKTEPLMRTLGMIRARALAIAEV